MEEQEIRRALKVTKLLIKLTSTVREVVIGELKRICEENDHHSLYNWNSKTRNVAEHYWFQTKDYNILAKKCLPHPKCFTRLEECGDPIVFLNILSQDQLFPDVWELAFNLKQKRDEGFHGIARPNNYWTEKLVDEYFKSVRSLINKFPMYIQMDVIELELQGLRQTYFDEEEVMKFKEEQKLLNEEQERKNDKLENVQNDQQRQLSSMQAANAQRDEECFTHFRGERPALSVCVRRPGSSQLSALLQSTLHQPCLLSPASTAPPCWLSLSEAVMCPEK